MRLAKRQVKMTGKLKTVMECFQAALMSNNIDNEEFYKKREKREGLWSIITAFFPQKLEGLANLVIKDNDVYIFDKIDMILDKPAEILCSVYNSFWRNVLTEDKVSDKESIDTNITDHNDLISEILMRLSIDAMRTNVKLDKDGLALLKTMRTFIDKIKESTVLITNNTPSHTVRMLATDHEKWMRWFHNMVSDQELIRSNIKAVLTLSNHLNEVKLITKRQLLTEFITQIHTKTAPVGIESFDEKLIESHFARYEDEFLTTKTTGKRLNRAGRANQGIESAMRKANNINSYINNSIDDYIESIKKSNLIIKEIDENETSVLKVNTTKVDKIKKLYELLIDTCFLEIIVQQLEILDHTTGWFAIMNGLVKMEGIAKHIRLYAEDSISVLEVDYKADFFTKNGSIANQLIAKNSTSGIQLHNLALNIASGFERLTDLEMKRKIGSLVKGSITSLQTLQKLSRRDIEYVDTEVCNYLTGSTNQIWNPTNKDNNNLTNKKTSDNPPNLAKPPEKEHIPQDETTTMTQKPEKKGAKNILKQIKDGVKGIINELSDKEKGKDKGKEKGKEKEKEKNNMNKEEASSSSANILASFGSQHQEQEMKKVEELNINPFENEEDIIEPTKEVTPVLPKQEAITQFLFNNASNRQHIGNENAINSINDQYHEFLAGVCRTVKSYEEPCGCFSSSPESITKLNEELTITAHLYGEKLKNKVIAVCEIMQTAINTNKSTEKEMNEKYKLQLNSANERFPGLLNPNQVETKQSRGPSQ